MEFIKKHLVLSVIAIIAASLLTFAYLQIKADLTAMRATTKTQLQIMERLVKISEKQLKLTEEQISISKKNLRISQESLSISKQQLQETRHSQYLLDQSLQIQGQLLSLAEALLGQTKEINQKTPSSFKKLP